MTLYDEFHRHVQNNPSAPAVVSDDLQLTYAELDEEVVKSAKRMYARGVRAGDSVLVMAGNDPRVIALYLAASKIGAIYAPVSPGFRSNEGNFVLRNARPRLAVIAEESITQFLCWDGSEAMDLVVLTSSAIDLPGRYIAFEDIPIEDATVPDIAIPDASPLLLCYTSGTTSNPKPVLHSQGSEIYNARTYGDVWNLSPQDRGVVCLPLAWVYGLSAATVSMLVAGGTVVLLKRFHPVEVLAAISEHAATVIWGTMSMYIKLLEVIKSRADTNLSTLRIAVNGAEPCPAPLVKEFEIRTGIKLLGSYATSEARPILAVRPNDDHTPEGSSGRLVQRAEIKLEGPDGSCVTPGETGRALLRCPGVMSEYYGNEELTAQHLTKDGWFRTDDLLRQDHNGYWFVVGRQSEMIIRSGINIAPAEIEAALTAHPAIAEAAVVGIPNQRSGQAIRAFISFEPNESATEHELREMLSKELAAYKIPDEIQVIKHIPRTERGKVDRTALRST